MSVAPYDVVKLFMANWRSAIATGRLIAGGVVHARMDGEILVVTVRFMPEGSFTELFLREGPGAGRRLFTVDGDDYWLGVHRLAMAAAMGADQRNLAAILLMPEAYEAARARLPEAA